MARKGFIVIDRKILAWRWYKDQNVKNLFLHLLITANYKNHAAGSVEVQRGQRLTSLDTLVRETGLTSQNVRTALKKLENSGEITRKSTNRFTLITICNYDKYQRLESAEQQTANKQLTNEQQTTNTPANNKQLRYNQENQDITRECIESTNQDKYLKERQNPQLHPPTLEDIRGYVQSKGYHFDAGKLFSHYAANGWHMGQTPILNWQAACDKWNETEKERYASKRDRMKPKGTPSYDLEEIRKNAWSNTEVRF